MLSIVRLSFHESESADITFGIGNVFRVENNIPDYIAFGFAACGGERRKRMGVIRIGQRINGNRDFIPLDPVAYGEFHRDLQIVFRFVFLSESHRDFGVRA